MITLQLTNDEAAFLLDELTKERRHVEDELIHTDKRSMQADISRDLRKLDGLRDRLAHEVELARSEVTV